MTKYLLFTESVVVS